MGKPATLLEGLSGHAVSFGAFAIAVEFREGRYWVSIVKKGAGIAVANYARSSADAKELRKNLQAAARRAVRTVIRGQVFLLKVVISDNSGEEAFAVSIDPAPKLDPAVPPSFTEKQGQYLAFIYSYIKLHRQAPAESDLQRYFQVSPPSVNQMVKTLERNGLIERTPGQARSIRLCVSPENLPPLE